MQKHLFAVLLMFQCAVACLNLQNKPTSCLNLPPESITFQSVDFLSSNVPLLLSELPFKYCLDDTTTNTPIFDVELVDASHSLSNHNMLKNMNDTIVRSEKIGLFDNFEYKGVAVSFAKSVVDYRGVGVGLKVPITPNFPHYDRKIYLPRVTAFVGVGYPANIKISLSVTVQLKAILHGLKLLERLRTRSAAKLGPLKAPKSSESIQRLGFTLNFKLDPFKGFRTSVGPSFAYVPNFRTVQNALPYVLVFPSVLLTFYNLLLLLTGAVHRHLLGRMSSVLWTTGSDNSDRDDHLQADGSDGVLDPLQNQRRSHQKRLHSLSLGASWRLVQGWVDKKKTSIQWTLGNYWSPSAFVPSSNLVFDLQPFFLRTKPPTRDTTKGAREERGGSHRNSKKISFHPINDIGPDDTKSNEILE